MTEAKLADLNTYESSAVLTAEEKLVLRLADALTSTPAHVSVDMFSELERTFTAEQLVELSSAIAWENYRARNNRLFDVESENYSNGAFCPMPFDFHA